MLRHTLILLTLLSITDMASAVHRSDTSLKLTCTDFDWGDVADMATPFMPEDLATALVMQGESSNYDVSSAARQAIPGPNDGYTLPSGIQKILQDIIDTECMNNSHQHL
ncbi:MAG: hypothetical protein OEX03_07470 [Gammaproteobacteria bacterium]|nr:hypothetical protein [Gammaproteobacteria bacterium]